MQSLVLTLFFSTLSLSVLLRAEDSPLPSAADTYIPETLEVPAFVPPPPFVPKVPLADAEATIILRDESGLATTLQRGQASMAPDIPEPEPVSEPAPVLRERPLPQIITINMSGVIYDHHVSVVTWRHPVTEQAYQAVLGFDVGLLSPIGEFVRDGVTHRSFLQFSNFATIGLPKRQPTARRRPVSPVPEIVPDGYRILQGDPTDTIGIQPLLALRDLFLAEKPRLQKLSEDLAVYRQESQAWADAHPAPTEAPVFWFKPHRNSRYLTPQDKSDQHQAATERAENAQQIAPQEGEAQP